METMKTKRARTRVKPTATVQWAVWIENGWFAYRGIKKPGPFERPWEIIRVRITPIKPKKARPRR